MHGADPSGDAVRIAQEDFSALRGRLAQRSVYSLAEEGYAPFAAVISLEVIPYVERPQLFAKVARELLAPGGPWC